MPTMRGSIVAMLLALFLAVWVPDILLVDHADMRRDHAPAVGEFHPGLHLAADLARHGGAMKQRRGHGAVAAVGGDDRFRNRAREPDRRARGAERGDLVMAVKDFGDAVADGARV